MYSQRRSDDADTRKSRKKHAINSSHRPHETPRTVCFYSDSCFCGPLNGCGAQIFCNKYDGLFGQMGHLLGPSGIGKAQLSPLLEAIMRPFRNQIEMEYMKRTPIIQNRGDGRDGRPP